MAMVVGAAGAVCLWAKSRYEVEDKASQCELD